MNYITTHQKPPLSFPSVSGSIVTFNSQYAGLPLKSHTIALTATQSGSGTPSPVNVRPISGYSELHICNTSKNLLKADKFQYNTSNIFLGCTDLSTPNYVFLKSGTYTITVNGNASVQASKINYGNANNTWILNDNPATITITTPTFYRFWISRTGGTISVGDIDNFQLEFGNEATPYEPHDNNSQIITIQIGSTVYGGEYDARTGVLTVTHRRDDMGTFTWYYNSSFNRFTTSSIQNVVKPPETSAVPSVLCEVFDIVSFDDFRNYTSVNHVLAIGNTGNISARATEYGTDANAFKTDMSGHYIVYELATPITIQLPPCPIDTLLGENNIWADTGDTTLQYPKFG